MRELILIVLLMALAVWPAIGSCSGGPRNVLQGECQISAVYPEQAEFIFNTAGGIVTITRIEPDGNYTQSCYAADFSEQKPGVFRALFCGDWYVEINSHTGETTLYMDCITELFGPGPGL